MEKEAERLLENWGRWCRDDIYIHLGYNIPEVAAIFNALKKGDLKRLPPINFEDAERANDAIIQIGTMAVPQDRRRLKGFDIYRFIVARWAHGKDTQILAHQFKCSGRTVYRWTKYSIDTFWQVYRENNLARCG